MGYKLEYPYTSQDLTEFLDKYQSNGLKIVTVENFVEVEIENLEDETIETSVENRPTYFALEKNEILIDGKIILNPNYEEEQKEKEHERIQELFMTRSDFFDGTIDAWGIGEEELLLVIKQVLDLLPFDEKTERKALNNFKNALNFYRKHTLFSLLVGNPIKLTDTIQVTLTDEELDKFFDEVNKGNKDTAWQYLPQPVEIPLPNHIEQPLDMV